MAYFPGGDDVAKKINSYNEKIFDIKIEIKKNTINSNNTITISTERENRELKEPRGVVFNTIKNFFTRWVKQKFETENNFDHTMNSDTERSVFFTFKSKKNLWKITDLTKKEIEKFKDSMNIRSKNFQLVSEKSIRDYNYDANVLIYKIKIKIPETAVSTENSSNNLKELRF